MKLLGLVFILFIMGCSKFEGNHDLKVIQPNELSGNDYQSLPYQVDYSQPESLVPTDVALFASNDKIFLNADCEDFSTFSENEQNELMGKVTVHLTVRGSEFSKYTYIEFFKGETLVGRTCEQAPTSGEVSYKDGQAYFINNEDPEKPYVVFSVFKQSSGQLIFRDKR